MPSKKILISACLLGQNVRYNAEMVAFKHSIIRWWQSQDLLIPVCPEVDGDLSVPRDPAEIEDGDGISVWKNQAKVVTVSGDDVSAQFKKGAEKALEITLKYQISMAILKERSPSCGHRRIYNGQFQGLTIEGMGVTAVLLEQHGIAVFSEEELESAQCFWQEGR
ncbi:MAG: DUF523 domain-containing protein [Deltaproteobacteria bacterium]|jgi:uncharacterized protein YbbK (DUF523 family)|nr:DUF523 domain-containing protein [Deltaproteobacteria bacterium]MBT4525693.1 DUF523 domain-containing protein [Deltaproteobacteria bacterium]